MWDVWPTYSGCGMEVGYTQSIKVVVRHMSAKHPTFSNSLGFRFSFADFKINKTISLNKFLQRN